MGWRGAALLLRVGGKDAEAEGDIGGLRQGTGARTLGGSEGAKDRPLQEPGRRPGEPMESRQPTVLSCQGPEVTDP